MTGTLNSIALLNVKQITSHCIISNNRVVLNGLCLFEQKADAPAFLLSAYQHFQLNYPKFYKMDNLSKLGWLAAELLLQDLNLKDRYTDEQIGLVLANSNSSLDADLRYSDTMNEAASPALFVYTLPNIVIGEISIRHKLKGENAFFINEQFDAQLIEQQVSLLMDSNVLQACICGWVELLGNEYKAALFLVEKNQPSGHNFLADYLMQLFNENHE